MRPLARHQSDFLRRFVIALLALSAASTLFVTLPGCASAGIAIREKLGYAKREQLVDRVQEARDGQEAAKVQFESALAEFLAVTKVSGGELEAQYNKLKREYDRSETRAGDVRSRITSVERVAAALFKEWEAELSQYESASLRSASEQQLRDTRREYDQLIGVMNTAAGRMDPVLRAFKDQVLFLKHNLNARAIASLQGTTAQIQTDVAGLIREMEASIAEANAFIDRMGKEK